MKDQPYIYRVQSKAPSGSPVWVVQISNSAGKRYARFHDKDYGGQDEALAEAIRTRDRFVRELGLDERLSAPANPHPGVSRTESRSRRNGYDRLEVYWQAYWPHPSGKGQATKRFAVSKHGEERAKLLAIDARRNALNAIEQGKDPAIEMPADATSLWRYMDFTKFLSLLEDSALFFSFAKNFDDPFEGAFARGNQTKRNFVLSRVPSRDTTRPPARDVELCISCWHSSRHESAAMWSLYAKSTDAVAIRTSLRSFRSLLPESATLGLVKYVDYSQSWIPEDNAKLRYFHKRLSFQHEHELRAVIDINDCSPSDSLQLVDNGLKVRIDLNRLIKSVYVSPKSARWFQDLVDAVCKRYGLKCKIVRSSLYDDPIR